MSKPVLHTNAWLEAEPTAPGGGRIRYTVETVGPAEGDSSYFVNLSEESVSCGMVSCRDHMLLDEADLTLMIAALEKARDVIRHAKTHSVCLVPPPGWTCSRQRGHEGPCAATEASS